MDIGRYLAPFHSNRFALATTCPLDLYRHRNTYIAYEFTVLPHEKPLYKGYRLLAVGEGMDKQNGKFIKCSMTQGFGITSQYF